MGESSPLTRQANNANPAQGATANLICRKESWDASYFDLYGSWNRIIQMM